ncbi:substrate-binding periplasmic protein [Salidesulfovibrio onnuriiensis]|uniref:substrate-binding periplasmic protein n=1 Tax=Salidesulfovibrio onnuriiensis TaxID=2583823 RepID=UPI0011CB8759|nr:transporter substrate-binding domain-containing protein [Salidesulfovibrio onnuriiensis]
MFAKLRRGIPGLCLLLLLAAPCLARAEQPVARVVTLFGYAPYCFTIPALKSVHRELLTPGEDSLHFQGYSWDIIREALHRAGFSIELSVAPWKRAYRATMQGEYDLLFPATKTPSREKIFTFGKVPVNDSRALLYVRKDSTLEWAGLDRLPFMNVAVQRGFSYGDEWEAIQPDQLRKYEVNSIELGFGMLLSGRVQAFAGYEANWDYVARQMEITDQLRKLPVFHNGLEYAIARRSDPQACLKLRALDRSMREMLEDGTIRDLRVKWKLAPLE